MIARSSTLVIARAFARHLALPPSAAITGVALTFAAPGHAQEADADREARTRPLHLHGRRRGRSRRQVPCRRSSSRSTRSRNAGHSSSRRAGFFPPVPSRATALRLTLTAGSHRRVFLRGTQSWRLTRFRPPIVGETSQLFVLGRQAKEQLDDRRPRRQRHDHSVVTAARKFAGWTADSARRFSASTRPAGSICASRSILRPPRTGRHVRCKSVTCGRREASASAPAFLSPTRAGGCAS